MVTAVSVTDESRATSSYPFSANGGQQINSSRLIWANQHLTLIFKLMPDSPNCLKHIDRSVDQHVHMQCRRSQYQPKVLVFARLSYWLRSCNSMCNAATSHKFTMHCFHECGRTDTSPSSRLVNWFVMV